MPKFIFILYVRLSKGNQKALKSVVVSASSSFQPMKPNAMKFGVADLH
jgi:hypothetical protein